MFKRMTFCKVRLDDDERERKRYVSSAVLWSATDQNFLQNECDAAAVEVKLK